VACDGYVCAIDPVEHRQIGIEPPPFHDLQGGVYSQTIFHVPSNVILCDPGNAIFRDRSCILNSISRIPQIYFGGYIVGFEILGIGQLETVLDGRIKV
jgi:hypothetical protein